MQTKKQKKKYRLDDSWSVIYPEESSEKTEDLEKSKVHSSFLF